MATQEVEIKSFKNHVISQKLRTFPSEASMSSEVSAFAWRKQYSVHFLVSEAIRRMTNFLKMA